MANLQKVAGCRQPLFRYAKLQPTLTAWKQLSDAGILPNYLRASGQPTAPPPGYYQMQPNEAKTDSGPTPADLLTQAAAPTLPVPAVDGFKIAQHIALPAIGAEITQGEYDRLARLLAVRSGLLDAAFNEQRTEAQELRAQATIEEVSAALAHDDGAKPWVAKDLRGRLVEAKARRRYAQEKRVQYQMEIAALAAALKGQ